TFITKLVSPKFDLGSLTNPTLTFWYANQEWFGDQNELRIYYKTSENGAWTMIPDAVYMDNITAWTKVELELPEPSSEYYLAFEGVSNWTRGVIVDDVMIAEGEEEEPEDGCLNDAYGAYPEGEFTPACTGTFESITDGDNGWFGEYSLVNVTAGTEYEFATDVATAYITISDAAGTT